MKSETTDGGTSPRKKTGRRPLFKGQTLKTVGIVLPESTIADLEEFSARAGRTRTEFTRDLIMTALENIKKEESGA